MSGAMAAFLAAACAALSSAGCAASAMNTNGDGDGAAAAAAAAAAHAAASKHDSSVAATIARRGRGMGRCCEWAQMRVQGTEGMIEALTVFTECACCAQRVYSSSPARVCASAKRSATGGACLPCGASSSPQTTNVYPKNSPAAHTRLAALPKQHKR